MNNIEKLLIELNNIAENPSDELEKHLEAGKKVIGCFPYYVPEELITAAGMIPFGIWGSEGTINEAKKYFPPFYCTIAQMGLEMALTGKLDKLSGVIIPSLCDTLRPLTQNFRVAVPQIPFIFLAHPQNRKPDYGIEYTRSRYSEIANKLEEISGVAISDESLKNAIEVHNVSRKLRREFVTLAASHPQTISPSNRSDVLKSVHFMDKAAHSAILSELNDELRAIPDEECSGPKIMVSGILSDSKNLLGLFEKYNFTIVEDDVAHQTRGFRIDVPDCGDPMAALAKHFANQDYDTILYDPGIDERPKFVANTAKKAGADGVLILMMQFCDPEEIEYPSLKKALDEQGIPHLLLGYDQQMQNFAQANTQLQAFADIISN